MKFILTILSILLVSSVNASENFCSSVLVDKYAYTFIGTFDGILNIQMELVRNGKHLMGTYFYEKYHTNLVLKGHIDDCGNVVLTEYDRTGKLTGDFTGKFTNRVTIKGIWEDSQRRKSYPFILTNTFTLVDTITLSNGLQSQILLQPNKDEDLVLVRINGEEAVEVDVEPADADFWGTGCVLNSIHVKQLAGTPSLYLVEWVRREPGQGIFDSSCYRIVLEGASGDIVGEDCTGGVKNGWCCWENENYTIEYVNNILTIRNQYRSTQLSNNLWC